MTANIVCYFRYAACSAKYLALQALQLKQACGHNRGEKGLWWNCSPPPLFTKSSHYICLLSSTSPTHFSHWLTNKTCSTANQHSQHFNTSALPSSLLLCPSVYHFLRFYTFSVGSHLNLWLPSLSSLLAFLFHCLEPICPFFTIYIKGTFEVLISTWLQKADPLQSRSPSLM